MAGRRRRPAHCRPMIHRQPSLGGPGPPALRFVRHAAAHRRRRVYEPPVHRATPGRRRRGVRVAGHCSRSVDPADRRLGVPSGADRRPRGPPPRSRSRASGRRSDHRDSGAALLRAPPTGAPYQAPQFPTYQPGYAPPGYARQPGYAQPGYPQPSYQPGYAPPNYPVPRNTHHRPTYPPTRRPAVQPGRISAAVLPTKAAAPQRRGLLISGIVAGFVVLALCAGLIGYELPIAAQQLAVDKLDAAGAGIDRPTAGSGVLSDDQLFQRRSTPRAALLNGDQKGWLAAVDPARQSAVAAYKRLYPQPRPVHVRLLEAVELGLRRADRRQADVQRRCERTASSSTACTDTRATLKVTALKATARSASRAIVAPKAELLHQRAVAVGGRARCRRSSASGWSWPRPVPGRASCKRCCRSPRRRPRPPTSTRSGASPTIYVGVPGEHDRGQDVVRRRSEDVDGVAYSISPHDIEIVIMMPTRPRRGYAGPGGLNAVIQHEMGHVATLWAAPDRSHGHDSFVEGIAEYCAYTGHTQLGVVPDRRHPRLHPQPASGRRGAI